MTARHVPLRTCTGCRQERPKREMVRVVRRPDGAVVVDVTGRTPGRGAYVCPSHDCWSQALRGSLARVLRTQIRETDLIELRQAAATYEEAVVAMAGSSKEDRLDDPKGT